MPPTPPRRKSTPTLDRQSEERSDNVQQLIREADEAFDSVGTGLGTDANHDFDTRVPEDETLLSPPPTRPAPPPPVRRRPSPLRQSMIKKRLSKPTLSPLKSPTRSASVSKANRQKSLKLRNGRQPRPVAKKQRSKWSVNAKDLLTIRLFSRLEVDEVLSPTRLREIRMSGASHLQSRRSSETLRTMQSDGSDTPVDPFNLQDLPSRIGAAGVRLSIPSPVVEVPTPRTLDFSIVAERRASPLNDEDNTQADSPSVSPLSPPEDTTPAQNPPEDEAMAFKDVDFPAPPAKNPLRFASTSRKDLSHLPSIPEVMVTTPENFTLATSSTTQPPLTPRPEADEPSIYLPSNPYTLTMPTFRHGPIRIAKADIALAYSSSKLATAAVVLDDSLDWTAFQMAILGGAGDLYGEATDYSRRDDREEDEAADLCEWFAEFGFAGWGRLDRGGSSTREAASPVATTVVEGECSSCSPASPSSSRSGRHLPIPVEKEFSSGFWHPRSGDEIGMEASSRFDRARSVGLRRWTVEGHPKRYEGTMSIDSGRRPSVDSVASLPQSPMLDLVVSRDSGGKEYIVPMGYNLSHDIGDFLSWEAQNVYAAAFQGLGNEEGGEAELEG
ncbi:hypothetical protein CONLIGDRAFT_684673 [Coniochaeta ligniaria NRRL 30616]|uniref:Uncharacterized protein n=1 Tax=Coniochaeta ligniaria NRRL 30616 TaxID=1408157 RepID=A0A1J7J8L7_9PEZI|nr:hypothetical protein CONLIGDRAFT_684673 [Coniochaeta ligniaria NRRL 30616]